MQKNYFLCIDLKSFFASVECVERGLDPMTAKLVVADASRGDGTVCLAVSPALKKLGVKNRCRVFEIPKNIEYIKAPPRMRKYIEYSADIYSCYLKFVSKDDIHVYSIDEVFIDITHYLSMYKMTPYELASKIVNEVLLQTGITASCGIGENMYLAKIAMDILSKTEQDRISYLNEELFIKTMWDHKPLTDFWMIGKGTAARLEKMGIYTMKDIAHYDEKRLYKTFGIDAELMIDHAWGREPVTMAQVKAYKSQSHSIDRGQVLSRNYNYAECKIIVLEMTELMCLELVDENLSTKSIALSLGYDHKIQLSPAKATMPIGRYTSSYTEIMELMGKLYERVAKPDGLYRRVNISFCDLKKDEAEQLDLFSDPVKREKEKNIQKAIVSIKKKFGKNAMIKGMNLQEGATTIERNSQIGGHKSGESKT